MEYWFTSERGKSMRYGGSSSMRASPWAGGMRFRRQVTSKRSARAPMATGTGEGVAVVAAAQV